MHWFIKTDSRNVMLSIREQTRRIRLTRILPPMFFMLCSLVFWWGSLSPASTASGKTTLFFYSTETNINNFKSLKHQFDTYLAQFGPYEFQPFSDKTTFEEQIKQHPNCLILLSSWHYENISADYRLKPILVGSRKGKTSQKRLLVTNMAAIELEAVKSGQIASASSVQYTRMLLSEMLQDTAVIDQVKILTVPKDIDALISLGFGMAKSAITTDYSLETLQTMNPVLYKKISVLAESQESRLLILAVPETCESRAEQFVTVLRNMAADPDGKNKLRMLGLDDWQSYDSSSEAKVENYSFSEMSLHKAAGSILSKAY